jgi:nitrate/nitrite transporter NarK
MSSAVHESRTEATASAEGWPVVAASSAAVFCTTAVFYTFAVLLKPLTDELSWSRSDVSSAFGAMTMGAAVSAPMAGHLFDRFGPRWISGPALALVGCAFASLALLTSSRAHLYATYTLIGVASTGTSAVVYARAIAGWFDRRRGAALAIVMASAALGGIVHPPAAAALIHTVGWRTACAMLGAAIVVFGVPLVVRFVRERPSPRAHAAPATAGVTVGDAVSSRTFWILLTVVFGSTLTVNSAIVHLSALLTLTDRGLTTSAAALVVSSMSAASLAGRLLTGWLLDRFIATRVSFAFLTMAAVGTFVLASADSFATGVLAAVLIGFGTGGEFDAIPYLLSRYFGLRALATLYGFNWMAWGVAGAVGPIVMARVFDSTGSYETVLACFAAGTLAASLLMLTLPAYDSLSRHTACA